MYYGQWETDKIIEKYFPGQKSGTCIEVGAYDGIKGSNSKYFEDIGWNCLCIEPNPFIFESLILNRLRSCCSAYACDNFTGIAELEVYDFESGIQSSLTSLDTDKRLINDYAKAIKTTKRVFVGVKPLADTIQSYFEGPIDFISIDTEGTELNVLKGLNLNINKPKLLVVENNYNDKDMTDYILQFGYTFAERYYVNNFYTRNEHV